MSVPEPAPRPQAPGGAAFTAAERRRDRWRRNLRLTGALLLVWFFVTFGVAFFARELSFDFFGWPFSFWVAAQGALIVYIGIVWFYARTMNRLDEEQQREDADPG